MPKMGLPIVCSAIATISGVPCSPIDGVLVVEWAHLLASYNKVGSKDLEPLREKLKDRVESIPTIRSDLDFINQVRTGW